MNVSWMCNINKRYSYSVHFNNYRCALLILPVLLQQQNSSQHFCWLLQLQRQHFLLLLFQKYDNSCANPYIVFQYDLIFWFNKAISDFWEEWDETTTSVAAWPYWNIISNLKETSIFTKILSNNQIRRKIYVISHIKPQ